MIQNKKHFFFSVAFFFLTITSCSWAQIIDPGTVRALWYHKTKSNKHEKIMLNILGFLSPFIAFWQKLTQKYNKLF